jgi:micrococcal nuclease
MPRFIPKLTRSQRLARSVIKKALVLAVAMLLSGGLVAADRWGAFGRAPTSDVQTYDGKSFLVVHSVDGDTLDIDAPDGGRDRTRIRLWAVDTPETVKPDTPPQHFGHEAGEFTKSLTLGKTVRLELDPRETRDKYGRLLAFLWLEDGRMLNRVLVEQGCAYADPRYPNRYEAEFNRLQQQAKKARRGLWKDVRNDDLPYYYKDKLPLP